MGQERQIHGFIFEKYIKEKYNIQDCPDNCYTHKWDGILNGYPVSIKLEQKNSDIELASLTRNAENKEDYYLIVGFWDKNKNNIVSTETLFIKGDEWHLLFNSKIVNECQTLIDTISNSPTDDEKWKKARLQLTKEWKENTPNLVRLRFKRDHKSQKRMQCAINNKDFYTYFIPKYRTEI